MPPSIDPITNLFSTGSSLIGRVIICFVAGWFGNFLSQLCAIFSDWSDFTNPGPALGNAFTFDGTEILNFILWPLILIHYLGAAPFYGVILASVIVVCLYKIIRSDDPVLFWAVLLVTALTPGMAITHGTIYSVVPLFFVLFGLGAGLWYAVNLEHPEWVDWFREKTGM